MKSKMICLAVVLTVVGAGTVAHAHWQPGDGHKMHWPQTPKRGGWDVEFSSSSLADDWMCSESGPVTDIHFWVSWMNDMWQPIDAFRVGIWSDWPAGAAGNPYPYSIPRTLLWERVFGPGEFVRVEQPQDLQGWFDPSSGSWELDNHTLWEQINIDTIRDPFIQELDSIYWLEIDFGPLPFIGWKETDQNWNDDGVFWFFQDWIELRSPIGESDFVRGDVDGDLDVDFEDAMMCMNGPPFLCDDAADANDDGRWDPIDCDYIVEWVGGGGPPPPPPFPECGSDPTADTLGCLDHPCGGAQYPSIDLAFVITGEMEDGVFIRGDVYPIVEGVSCGDGLTQMSDATAILRCLYVPGAACPRDCWDCADCDDNGIVLMSDAVYLLKALYVPGAPLPPAPYPGCGSDETPQDTLSGDCSCHWCN